MPKKAKVEKPKKEKKERTKRKPSEYAQFVKEHYKDKDVQALPPKQRFGLIAKKWKKEKAKRKKTK